MKISQIRWTIKEGWQPCFPDRPDEAVHLVFVFGSTSLLKTQSYLNDIRQAFPDAHLFGCSTAGEICGTRVDDNSLAVTAIRFEHTSVKGAQVKLVEPIDSFRAGGLIAASLDKDNLAHVIVLSDGINVNGSDLVKGLTKGLPENITVTGGLAGDGDRFSETLVFYDNAPERDTVSAIGFYGNRLKVGYGSLGGWDPFGPERLITRATGNIVYEFDGKPALELYKKYLGEHAKGLPATGLLFPLSLRTNEGESRVVRTILSINEDDQSMIFAGDVPEGSYARLMKANFDRLIDGAIGAAKTSYKAIGSFSPELALLISCVGRKMLLRQRTEEEVEGVKDVLGNETVLTGFYSYGEISPFAPGSRCELHNQTMTITVFSEE
jgi:hypothetical protein